MVNNLLLGLLKITAITVLLFSYSSIRKYFRSNVRPIVILYWEYPHIENIRNKLSETSDVGDCIVTNDQTQILEAKAVVFHDSTLSNPSVSWNQGAWRHRRSPDQVFVWWSQEAPPTLMQQNTLGKLMKRKKDFFNWTMTYRWDSDVPNPYGTRGRAIKSVEMGVDAVDRLVASKDKRKVAIWLVSRCGTTRGRRMRMKYAMSLMAAGMAITPIGRCFQNQLDLPRRDAAKQDATVARYKFYLSFENARHCRDYISEKFWRHAIYRGVVPIVWGAAKRDVLAAAPLGSFIHADDFASPRDLAAYVARLNADDAAYRRYFRWRERADATDHDMWMEVARDFPDVEVRPSAPVVGHALLCRRLHESGIRSKTIHSLHKELAESNSEECYKPRGLLPT